MPRAWSAKRERQYEHIKEGLEEHGRSEGVAEEIAARTVNKERARSGEAESASPTSTRDISSGRRGGLRSHAGPGGRTRDQLYAEARRKKIPGRSKMTKAQLAQAVANARKATLQLTRDEAQYRAGGIPKGQLDDTRAAADSANAQVRELTHEVQVARLPGRSQQLLAQSAQVEAAQAAVAQAQWKLDQKRVSAPAKGRIYDTLYRVGEWVQAGSPVVQMLPPQNVKVRFFVPETVVGSLAPGRALTIHCDGCASDVNAKITYVSSSAEYTPPVIYSNESRAKLVFMVEAHPSVDDAPRLHPGQPVSVTLQ